MKSYLRFLSRNKLYTAIEVVGLSVALAFVIVLSSYIVDDMSTNDVLKNTFLVVICAVAVGAVIGLLDYGFSQAINALGRLV